MMVCDDGDIVVTCDDGDTVVTCDDGDIVVTCDDGDTVMCDDWDTVVTCDDGDTVVTCYDANLKACPRHRQLSEALLQYLRGEGQQNADLLNGHTMTDRLHALGISVLRVSP
ncbi:hypothetical protein ACOMHN_055876 [Nucella lapillus]